MENYCCVTIGTDSTNVERTYKFGNPDYFLKNNINAINPGYIFDFIRNTFFKFTPGEQYSDNDERPYSFFYCPVYLKNQNPDIHPFIVWGICGLHSDVGRSANYMQYRIDSYDKLYGKYYFYQLFGSSFWTDENIRQFFNPNTVNKPQIHTELSEDIIPAINRDDRMHVCRIVEKLNGDNVVIVKMFKTRNFNTAAKSILIQVLSLIPSRLRKDIGFITYIQRENLLQYENKFASNIRLIIVNADVNLTDIYTRPSFSIVDLNYPAANAQEDILLWSHLEYDVRERQSVLFEQYLIKQSLQPSDFMLEMINNHKEALNYIKELENGTYKHSISTIAELVNTHYNNKYCRIVPSANEAFIKAIPQMLPEGKTLEKMLLEIIESVDPEDRARIKYCAINFLNSWNLIPPFREKITAIRKTASEEQSAADKNLIDSLNIKNAETTAKLDELICQQKKLDSDYQSLLSINTQLENANKNFMSEKAELYNTLEKNEKSIQNITDEKDNFENLYRKCNDDLSKQNLLYEKAQRDITIDKEKLFQLSVELNSIERERDKYISQNKQKNDELSALQKKYENAQKHIVLDEEKISKLSESLRSCEIERDKYSDQYNQKMKDLSALQKQYDDARVLNKTNEEKKQKMKAELQTYYPEVTRPGETITSSEVEMKRKEIEYKKSVVSMNEKFNNLKEEYDKISSANISVKKLNFQRIFLSFVISTIMLLLIIIMGTSILMFATHKDLFDVLNNHITSIMGEITKEDATTDINLDIANQTLDGSLKVGNFFAKKIITTGGVGDNKTFTIISGILPAGLSLDKMTGNIKGTPTKYRSSTTVVTVKVTDSVNESGAIAKITIPRIAKGSTIFKKPDKELIATYGDILSSVLLPSGYKWIDDSLIVGDAGTNSLNAIYNSDPANYEDSTGGISVAVNKKKLTVTGADATEREFDKTTSVAITKVTISGIINNDSVNADITGVSGIISSANAATYKFVDLTGITLIGTAANNYEINATESDIPATIKIDKADVPVDFKKVNDISVPPDNLANIFNVSDLLPPDKGETSYKASSADIYTKNISVEKGIVTFDTAVSDTDVNETITVNVTMQNYNSVTVSINVTIKTLTITTGTPAVP